MKIATFAEAVSAIENTDGDPHKIAVVIEGMENSKLSDNEWDRLFELIQKLTGIWHLKTMPAETTIH